MARKKTTRKSSKKKPAASKSRSKKRPASRKKSAKKSASRSRRKAPAADPTLQDPTLQDAAPPTSPFALTNEYIEDALLDPSQAGTLRDYFGPEGYEELRQLAADAQRTSVRGSEKVWLLPGIMGSKLGSKRSIIWDDVVWFDPVDVARGKLDRLALRRGSRIVPLGVLQITYLKMKLRLTRAGFDVSYYPYDWRQDIRTLGKELATDLAGERQTIHLVCHSMGGLVARAAMKANRAAIRGRVIMLGTPNFGSVAAIHSMRGKAPMVHTIAKIDLTRTPTELAEDVLLTFPGLAQLLPAPGTVGAFRPQQRGDWPADAPRPSQSLLNASNVLQDALVQSDDALTMICGVDQETLVAVEEENGTLVYERSRDGDGTVPRYLAELPGAPTYYIAKEHGSLPNSKTVARATAEILRTGATTILPTSWTRSGSRGATRVTEDELLREAALDTTRNLSTEAKRAAIAAFAAPPRSSDEDDDGLDAGASGGTSVVETAIGAPPPLSGDANTFSLARLDVSRRTNHSIEICIAKGSIVDVNARAIVLGLFRDVDPGGAAKAVDAALDGAIHEFTARRMFSGQVGEVFPLPCGRHYVHAETTMFVGLGNFADFHSGVASIAAENVIRTAALTHIEDLATVLIGAGSGASVREALRAQLAGYVKGVHEIPLSHRVRRITICEYDADRYAEICREIHSLSGTDLFRDVRVSFDQITIPETVRRTGPQHRELLSSRPEANYLYVRFEVPIELSDPSRPTSARVSQDTWRVHSSLLTSGGAAAVLTDEQEVSRKDLDTFVNGLEARSLTPAKVNAMGVDMAKMLLAPRVLRGLRGLLDGDPRHLVVVHEAEGSRIPWELLRVGNKRPALLGGMSRRYLTDGINVARWLESRRASPVMRLLMIVNPTEDLPGAEEECDAIRRTLGAIEGGRFEIDTLSGPEATRAAILARLRTGAYDVVHYAGHAFFDPQQRSHSGLICAGEEVLSSGHIGSVGSLPALLVFNACQSGRLRKPAQRQDVPDMVTRVTRNASVAEALLQGGLANFIGTYWSVGDASAAKFASTLYEQLATGEALGESIVAARERVRSTIEWPNYAHYGSYEFRLKHRGA